MLELPRRAFNDTCSTTAGIAVAAAHPLMRVEGLSLSYGRTPGLQEVSFDLYEKEVLVFIGPSGSGKTSALKSLNRMHDNTRDVQRTGRIFFRGKEIHGPEIDPPAYRRQFGWVAQKPTPFPASIWENVAYGARLHRLASGRAALEQHVEDCLRRAHLWDEVKDRLHCRPASTLSGGQQQRLCIARALATQPEVMLLDEPTGSIDPVARAKVEELILELRENLSVVMVTHSLSEAARLANRVAYFHKGQLQEIDTAEMIFTNAQTAEARAFVEGR